MPSALPVTATAIDTFARDHLPAPAQQPQH